MKRFINYQVINFAAERPTNFRLGMAPKNEARRFMERREYRRARLSWVPS